MRLKPHAFDRTNQSWLARWWWTVDHPTLFALVALIGVGAVLVTAASPAVATRIGLDPYYFITRQHVFLLLSLLTMVGVSVLEPWQMRRLAVLGFAASVGLMFLVPFLGVEVKGAHRWVSIAGISIQPSEFLKPCFAVVMAWIFAERVKTPGFPGWRIAMGLYVLVVALLLAQPDFGMTLTVTFIWAVQFFIAGLPFYWIPVLVGCGLAGIFAAYHLFPHVQKRMDMFLDPTSSDNYQVVKSLDAFSSGGFLGRGPGEGIVKRHIPDSHTDFIFSVAGEEFGIIACLLILMLFAFVVVRGFLRASRETDLFALLAMAGLLAQFGIQSIINMGVAVNLLPAKGMTLPFLSYGGSSLVAVGLGMGMLLALTRKKYEGKRQ